MLWAEMAWPGIVLMPTGWSFFLYEYALAKKVKTPVWLFCLCVAPVVISSAAITNGFHGQFYSRDFEMVMQDGRAHVHYEHGPFFDFAVGYIYLLVVSAWIIAGMAAFKAGAAVRGFFTKLFVITLLPMIANLGYLFADLRFFGVDPTPFAYSMSVFFVVWLMVDNRWVDMSAIGRDLLYYHSKDPIFIFGMDGRLFDASPEAKSLFDSHKLLPGDNVHEINDIGDIYRQLVINDDIDSFPIIRRGIRSFAPRVYPIDLLHVKSKLGWVLALVDVTAQEDATERAQAADLAKTQFLSTVSHELRTPLTVITGALKMLNQKNLDIPPEQGAKLIERAYENSQTLAKLVDDLLDVQRIENAQFSVAMERFELTALVRESVGRIENYQSGKPIKFDLIEDGKPIHVCADRHRIGQVLANILSNAIKFCGDPGHICVRLTVVGAMVRVSVADNGAGIPDGAHDRVFGRFTQVDSSDTRNRGGSGLGMHISRQILKQHNGSISYESKKGEGTTFTVTLPLAPELSDEAADETWVQSGVLAANKPAA